MPLLWRTNRAERACCCGVLKARGSADENEPGCSFSSEFRKRARKTLLYGRPFSDWVQLPSIALRSADRHPCDVKNPKYKLEGPSSRASVEKSSHGPRSARIQVELVSS